MIVRKNTVERSKRVASLIDGGETPESVADLLDISRKYVSDLYQLATGKRPSRRKPKSRIPAAVIGSLGKLSDREISRKIRMSASAVRRYRQNLGIPAFRTSAQSPMFVPNEAVEMMGKMSDYKIAQQFGLSRATIYKYRQRLKIAPSQDPRRPAGVRLPPITQESVDLFGKMSDADIAKKFGIKISRLREKRVRLGIPCFRESKRRAEGNTDQDWSWWTDPRPKPMCRHGKPNELCAICERAQREAMALATAEDSDDDD